MPTPNPTPVDRSVERRSGTLAVPPVGLLPGQSHDLQISGGKAPYSARFAGGCAALMLAGTRLIALAAGACTVSVNDSAGARANVLVAVSPISSALAVSRNVLVFNDTTPHSVVVTESGYTGAFSVEPGTCARWFRMTPLTGRGPLVNLAVRPIPGTTRALPCIMLVRDALGKVAAVRLDYRVSPSARSTH